MQEPSTGASFGAVAATLGPAVDTHNPGGAAMTWSARTMCSSPLSLRRTVKGIRSRIRSHHFDPIIALEGRSCPTHLVLAPKSELGAGDHPEQGKAE